jgi:hypothetical protein
MLHASKGTLTTALGTYEDKSCVMGYSGVGLRQPNTPHKYQEGWIPSTNALAVTTNGTYTIQKSEDNNTSSTQTLKIVKPDTNETFFVSYRYPTGFDTVLLGDYSNKVSIHRWNELAKGNTYLVSVLDTGESFADSTNGITIKHLSHDANAAVVSVNFGAANCSHKAPTLDIYTWDFYASTGQTVKFPVTLKNNDFGCPGTTFNISEVLPSGWTSSMTTAQVALASGASTTFNWAVTSPMSATDGIYPLSIKATESQDSTLLAQDDANYVLYNFSSTCDKNPTVTVTPVSNTGTKNYTIAYDVTVKSNDANNCDGIFNLSSVLPAGWKDSFQRRENPLAGGQSETFKWYVTSASNVNNGTYPLTIKLTNSQKSSQTSQSNADYLVTNLPSFIKFIEPYNGILITERTLFVAKAMDTRPLLKVEFYIDDVLVKTDRRSPYQVGKGPKKFTPGVHKVSVKAYDMVGIVVTDTIYLNK